MVINYLTDLKKNQPNQINYIEKFLETLDTFMLLMKFLDKSRGHIEISLIEEKIGMIQIEGLRQTVTDVSGYVSDLAIYVKYQPCKVLPEQEMLERLLYDENIDSAYLS